MDRETISHYRILKKLGEGGMGEVYLAQDLQLDRKVALKMLPLGTTRDEDRFRRFQLEAKSASALNHPNILTIYQIGEEDSLHFIATEFIDGVTLREHAWKKQLKMSDVLEVAIQIASALTAAHEAGITHRDIKPENIMVRRDGYVKVLDFGLAKLTERKLTDSEGPTMVSTEPGMVMGTMKYMSPEQARGLAVDARTDIWSLGVVLYEVLAGSVPFDGKTASDVIVSVLERQPPPLAQNLPEVPAELERIINKALRKEKEERYQSIKEMAADLKSLRRALDFQSELERSGPPNSSIRSFPIGNASQTTMDTVIGPAARTSQVVAHPTTSVEYLVTEIKRHKRTAALIAIAALLITVGGVLAVRHFQEGSDSMERIPIAVADFTNETKEEDLNGLSGMLITSLEQSHHLTVITRSRMFDVLKQLGKNDVDRIDEPIGREICQQANINTLLTASIHKFDQLYTIDLKVLDLQKNEYLFTAREEGQGKASIPAMIDRLAEKARAGFKEKGSEIQTTNQHVADTTTANIEAYQHYFQGEQYINKYQFKEAEKEFNKAIELDPTFALAYYRLAFATSWYGGERATKPMLKAMQYIAKAPEKERYLIKAFNAHTEGNRDEAIKLYQEVLQSYPTEKEALFEVGDLLVHKGDHLPAISYFDRALAIDPVFERALGHIVWTYELLGQYDKALEYAKQHVARLPSEESYRELAQVYVLQGDFDNALQTYQRTLETFPTSAIPIKGVGEIYIFKDEYDKAETEFQKLLREDRPLADKREGYWNLALLDAYRGKYQDVDKTLDQVIELSLKLGDTSGLTRSYAQKAFWLAIAGKREEAEKAIDRGLELSTVADNRFYITLLYTYLVLGEYDKAGSVSKNQLADYYPFDAAIRDYSHAGKGECEAMTKDAQASAQAGLVEQRLVSWYLLEQCYLALEQDEQGISAAQKMQKIYYNYYSNRAVLYPKSFYLLGRIYQQKGDKKLALENYEKFLTLWKGADKDLPEVTDAQIQVSKLKQ
jgi:eukaryotic-like serine/threonine-protein kinase